VGIALNLGSDIGLAGVSTQVIDEPTRFKVEWNGAVILDTGYIGLNSVANYNALIAAGVNEDDISLQKPLDGLVNNGNGKLLFDKYSSVDDARVIVDSPLANTIWILNRVSPSLKPFYIDTVDADTKANACTQCPSRQYYHNGIGVLPAVNDRIYITSDGSQVYNGNDSLHMIDTALCTVPTSAGKSFVGVDTSGNVVSINPCDCFEYAEPFIYQENISIDSLDPVNIPIQTLGNPESFSVVSNCVEYIVNGGTTSTLITYTDCNSNAVTLTVGATLVRNICALSTPTIVRGDGSVVSNGTCLSHIFPKGISFSEGAIIGNPVEELSFSFTINATNCFGTSPDRTINVDIKSSSYYKPFLVDVKNFKTQSSDACSITPISSIEFTTMYFNGPNPVPTLRDRIYSDQDGRSVFSGGDKWYFVDNSQEVIKIDRNGYVAEVYACPGTTTTTTSTTTTTVPAVGNYYTARTCVTPSTQVVLLDTTLSAIVPGNIVKTDDGNCFEISGTTTGSYPYYLIENPVVIYADCTTCTDSTRYLRIQYGSKCPVVRF
jgi:hypothetical protein